MIDDSSASPAVLHSWPVSNGLENLHGLKPIHLVAHDAQSGSWGQAQPTGGKSAIPNPQSAIELHSHSMVAGGLLEMS